MRLTRRGRVVRDIALLILLAVIFLSIVLAWESGQSSQCRWYRQHEPQHAGLYCDGGR